MPSGSRHWLFVERSCGREHKATVRVKKRRVYIGQKVKHQTCTRSTITFSDPETRAIEGKEKRKKNRVGRLVNWRWIFDRTACGSALYSFLSKRAVGTSTNNPGIPESVVVNLGMSNQKWERWQVCLSFIDPWKSRRYDVWGYGFDTSLDPVLGSLT